MEMEVDNSTTENDGAAETVSLPEPEIVDKTDPPKESEDSIFEEMRNLVQPEDTDNDCSNEASKVLPEPLNEEPLKNNEPENNVPEPPSASEPEKDQQQVNEETNPQIQMEDLKVAEEEMNEVDVVVCGGCHNVYHFVEDLTRHKPQCSRKSNFRSAAIENKAQVWAFLLWKNAQAKHVSRSGTVVEESSWKLYQKWCKMPERMRNAWIAAGGAVMTYTSFSTKPQLRPLSPPPIHNIFPKSVQKTIEGELANGESDVKPVVMKKLVQRDHLGEIKEIRSPNNPPPPKPTTLKDEIESIRNQLEGKETTFTTVENGGTLREEEFVVEKIVSRRFNPKKKQYEYLLKWEGYPPEQNTWEPAENLETCQHLLKQFEDNLVKQNIGKTKTPSQVKKISDEVNLPGPSTSITPGRPVRHSKQKALNQVKQWCGSIKPDDMDGSKLKRKYDFDSDEDDFMMKRYRLAGESDSEDSFSTASTKMYKPPLPTDGPPIKRKVGRPPKNRNIVNGLGPSIQVPPPNLEPNLCAALGLESDSEDSPLAVLNQRAASTRVSNLSPLNQQVLVANAKGVVKVDPSQVPNLTSGVYIMSHKSIVKLDSVTPSKALALKGQQNSQTDNANNKSEGQVVMLKHSGLNSQKSGIVRKSPGLIRSHNTVGRPPKPTTGSIRVNTPSSKLQSGIVPRSSVAGVTSGIRPRGAVTNVRVPIQKKVLEPEKKIFIGTKTVGRGGLKSGIHRKSSINKVNSEDLESKLKDLKAGETADIFEDLPESESSESDVGIPDDFPKEIGPIEPASPPRPLTLCPLTGKVLSKAEGEKTPEPTPPPSPRSHQIGDVEIKKEVDDSREKIQTSQANLMQSTSIAPKALFVNPSGSGRTVGSSVVSASVSGMGKPLIVNTSQSQSSTMVVSAASSSRSNQQQEVTIIPDGDEEDMVTITGEDGLVYKVSNSDLGSLLGGEDGEQCVYVTEGDNGDAVLALAQYPGNSALTSLTMTEGATLSTSELSDDQQFYIKQESSENQELVTLQQETEEPQVIAQLVEASEPAPGGQRRVVLLLPDGNLMMTEVDEEQYAALELDK